MFPTLTKKKKLTLCISLWMLGVEIFFSIVYLTNLTLCMVMLLSLSDWARETDRQTGTQRERGTERERERQADRQRAVSYTHLTLPTKVNV